jgi:hypothetical protein
MKSVFKDKQMLMLVIRNGLAILLLLTGWIDAKYVLAAYIFDEVFRIVMLESRVSQALRTSVMLMLERFGGIVGDPIENEYDPD